MTNCHALPGTEGVPEIWNFHLELDFYLAKILVTDGLCLFLVRSGTPSRVKGIKHSEVGTFSGPCQGMPLRECATSNKVSARDLLGEGGLGK